MKKVQKLFSVFIALVMVIALLPMLNIETSAANLKVKNVIDNKRTIYVGSVFQIKTNASKVTYTSSKPKVASVSKSGLITAKKKGKTTITVKNTANGKKVKLKITVKKPKGYTISKKTGTYSGKTKIKIKAKKGYTVYYTTGNKFTKAKKIASKKSKTITISKNTTLKLYVKKNSKKISVKKMNKTKAKSPNVVTYKYVITTASAANNNTNQSSTVVNNDSTATQPTTTVISENTQLEVPEVPKAEAADTSVVNQTVWTDEDIDAADTKGEWDELSPVYVSFTDSGITLQNSDGEDVSSEYSDYIALKKKVLKITQPGTYVLSGTLTDGSVQVKSTEGEYTVILNGVDVTSSTTAAFYATKKASKLTVILAKGSENKLTGPEEFTFEEGEDEPDAVMFAKKEMLLTGTGSLEVTSPIGDAIKCKDQLKISGGNITVNAQEDGITGKDCFAMINGTLNITSEGDGIKTNLSTDPTLGYVDISGGKITIKSNSDGIQADTTASFANADIDITTSYLSETTNDSFKGIKAGGDITVTEEITEEDGTVTENETTSLVGSINIKSGNFVLNTVEDSIKSKKDIVIEGGNLTVTSYGDGIQAEYNLTITGDDTVIDVTTLKNSAYTFNSSYKGLKAGTSTDDGNVTSEGTLLIQSGIITVDTTGAGITSGSTKGDDAIHCNNILSVEGGDITVKAGDDAFHSDNKLVISGGNLTATQCYEGIESYEIYLEGGATNITSSDDGVNAAGGNDGSGNAGNNTNPWQRPGGMGDSSSSSSGTLYIDGGVHCINADGDGLDSNGDIYMTGGEVYVYGPTSGGNGIFDYGESNNFFQKSGGLLIGTGTSDMAVYPTCVSGALCTYSVKGTAGKECTFTDNVKTYSFTPTKSYSLVIISTPNMVSGTKYSLSYNGGTTASATASTTAGSGNSSSNPSGR